MAQIQADENIDGSPSKQVPDVSVVLPIYNAEPFLREALDSVTNQTHRNIEIICVNDGSKDSSLSIMKEYASRDPRIVIDDGPNGGYGKAMNRGINRARGRYIGILEPDDTLLPSMFETLLRVADRDDLDFVRADFNRFTKNDDGKYIYFTESICHGDGSLYNKVLNPQNNLALLNVRMQNWTGIYRKSFLDAHAIRFHESPGARFQDNSFWFQTYCWATRIEYVDQPFYCHRDDNPNSSTNRSDLMFAMLDEWAWIRDYLARYPEKEHKLIKVFNHRKFHNCNFAFGKLADELQLPYLQRFSKELNDAYKQGELDLSMFSQLEQKKLQALMEDPKAYLEQYRKDRAERKTAQDFEIARRAGFRALFSYYLRTEGIVRAIGHTIHGAIRRLFHR
ncbi:glycosyltransferase [Enorma massiliensis]|uniref:glycosyltransferase family 2 protein n=1 Tax=Enorma massiliensis TaxID=1472761 RepID=UPI00195DB508|nr:glycosyltransferase [Enorma massiliensis]MBM6891758.1 glycosyltransferase [Enorma massiliensis]